jgi:serine/threonine-protein kinase
MSAEPQIRELLEEILDSTRSPEEACAQFPELLPEVRRRLKRMQSVESEIDALFPTSNPDRPAPSSSETQSAERGLPQIEGYDVQEVLGYGGMGVVYRARHLKLKRTVALKMMLSGAYATAQELARFVREAEAVAGLEHPHIVQVHDVGDLAGRPDERKECLELWADVAALLERAEK